MTVGILMEKPSAARNGSKAWGGTKGTFDSEQYVITHARGHLYEFVAPDKMVDPSLADKYKNWDLTNLPWDLGDFSWANEPIKGTTQVRNDVKQVLSGCDEIAIATDWDESGEGDAIAINALVELGLTGKKISRLHFTDESEKSLRQAFKDRRPVQSVYDHPAFKKAHFRSMFDFASMQWSRAATHMARQSGQNTVLRQGRLKSAMVKLVGDQLKTYNDYVKRPFFQNRFHDENAVVYTNPDEPRFDRADQVPQEYTASPVLRDSAEMRRTTPPMLLDLAALSSMLVSQGVKAQITLKTYQAMYEHQVVSYPRTEDKTITPQQHAELAPLADRIAAVAGVDTKHLTHREPRKTHVKPVGAHGANRPGPNVPSSLEDIEQRFGIAGRLIYQTLAKNYLAMLAADYEYEQQKGHVEKYPDFKGISNVPKKMGWKSIFDPDAGDEDTADDEDESAQGLGGGAEPYVHEGANKRPEHPRMKWLMKQLEKRDVGTGATRTSTYSEITSAKVKNPLLLEKGNKLTLASAGEMSWLLLPDTHIGDLSLTEKIYADMRAVAEGSADPDQLLARVADWVRKDIEVMTRNADAMRATLGLAKTEVAARAEGVWTAAPDGPKKVSFKKVWAGHEFTDDEINRLLAGEEIFFEAMSKAGKSFSAKGRLGLSEFKGRRYVGFQLEVPNRPQAWCKRSFSEDEKQALEAGETLELDGFVSKNDKAFSAKVSWDAKAKRIVPHFDDKKSKPRTKARA